MYSCVINTSKCVLMSGSTQEQEKHVDRKIQIVFVIKRNDKSRTKEREGTQQLGERQQYVRHYGTEVKYIVHRKSSAIQTNIVTPYINYVALSFVRTCMTSELFIYMHTYQDTWLYTAECSACRRAEQQSMMSSLSVYFDSIVLTNSADKPIS